MKLSLRWLFDHLKADWSTINVPELVQSFIKTTAEIEHVEHITCPIDSWFISTVKECGNTNVILNIPENNLTLELSLRTDAKVGAYYLIKKDGDGYLWVTMSDVGSEKEGLLPAFHATKKDLREWRRDFEKSDWIISVDNKSINHRPDLWGHRGIAKEIAVKHGYDLIPEKKFLTLAKRERTDSNHGKCDGITIENNAANDCTRFAAVALSNVKNKLSDLSVVIRLARTDLRSIDAIVDGTNYVMLDWGHPLHAFDAEKIHDQLQVRHAVNKETLALLDSTTITLQETDVVIADKNGPLSLAGIMGGTSSAVTMASGHLIIEAACFNAAAVRRSSMRLGKRTESSARFEKSLNPAIIGTVISRYLKFIEVQGIKHTIASDIVEMGPIGPQKTIVVTHALIEERLGVLIDKKYIKSTLKELDFEVTFQDKSYHIKVPHSRAKDMNIPEDIVEEIGRFYGFDQIPAIVPLRAMKPFDMQRVLRTRYIKRYFSYATQLREQMTYAFFDESFLRKIAWQPDKALQVQSSVSENHTRLVTTLIPNLLKSIQEYASEQDSIGIYELAQIWPNLETGFQEQTALSGIIAHFKKELDFYVCKAMLEAYFQELSLSVQWKKCDQPKEPWYMPYQTVHLFHNEYFIGIAGKANPLFYNTIAFGDAFIWELNADYLLQYQSQVHRYEPASKYPRVQRDISILVPSEKTVQLLTDVAKESDKRINSVVVVDFFEKKEWHDKRSITLRVLIEDQTKTLTSAEVDQIMDSVSSDLQKQGAQVR